ncbi:hypothetical protein V8C86DRAFT_161037 [Haematococcus lacustris]
MGRVEAVRAVAAAPHILLPAKPEVLAKRAHQLSLLLDLTMGQAARLLLCWPTLATRTAQQLQATYEVLAACLSPSRPASLTPLTSHSSIPTSTPTSAPASAQSFTKHQAQQAKYAASLTEMHPTAKSNPGPTDLHLVLLILDHPWLLAQPAEKLQAGLTGLAAELGVSARQALQLVVQGGLQLGQEQQQQQQQQKQSGTQPAPSWDAASSQLLLQTASQAPHTSPPLQSHPPLPSLAWPHRGTPPPPPQGGPPPLGPHTTSPLAANLRLLSRLLPSKTLSPAPTPAAGPAQAPGQGGQQRRGARGAGKAGAEGRQGRRAAQGPGWSAAQQAVLQQPVLALASHAALNRTAHALAARVDSWVAAGVGKEGDRLQAGRGAQVAKAAAHRAGTQAGAGAGWHASRLPSMVEVCSVGEALLGAVIWHQPAVFGGLVQAGMEAQGAVRLLPFVAASSPAPETAAGAPSTSDRGRPELLSPHPPSLASSPPSSTSSSGFSSSSYFSSSSSSSSSSSFSPAASPSFPSKRERYQAKAIAIRQLQHRCLISLSGGWREPGDPPVDVAELSSVTAVRARQLSVRKPQRRVTRVHPERRNRQKTQQPAAPPKPAAVGTVRQLPNGWGGLLRVLRESSASRNTRFLADILASPALWLRSRLPALHRHRLALGYGKRCDRGVIARLVAQVHAMSDNEAHRADYNYPQQDEGQERVAVKAVNGGVPMTSQFQPAAPATLSLSASVEAVLSACLHPVARYLLRTATPAVITRLLAARTNNRWPSVTVALEPLGSQRSHFSAAKPLLRAIPSPPQPRSEASLPSPLPSPPSPGQPCPTSPYAASTLSGPSTQPPQTVSPETWQQALAAACVCVAIQPSLLALLGKPQHLQQQLDLILTAVMPEAPPPLASPPASKQTSEHTTLPSSIQQQKWEGLLQGQGQGQGKGQGKVQVQEHRQQQKEEGQGLEQGRARAGPPQASQQQQRHPGQDQEGHRLAGQQQQQQQQQQQGLGQAELPAAQSLPLPQQLDHAPGSTVPESQQPLGARPPEGLPLVPPPTSLNPAASLSPPPAQLSVHSPVVTVSCDHSDSSRTETPQGAPLSAAGSPAPQATPSPPDPVPEAGSHLNGRAPHSISHTPSPSGDSSPGNQAPSQPLSPAANLAHQHSVGTLAASPPPSEPPLDDQHLTLKLPLLPEQPVLQTGQEAGAVQPLPPRLVSRPRGYITRSKS